jgi:hypothetical protein
MTADESAKKLFTMYCKSYFMAQSANKAAIANIKDRQRFTKIELTYLRELIEAGNKLMSMYLDCGSEYKISYCFALWCSMAFAPVHKRILCITNAQ